MINIQEAIAISILIIQNLENYKTVQTEQDLKIAILVSTITTIFLVARYTLRKYVSTKRKKQIIESIKLQEDLRKDFEVGIREYEEGLYAVDKEIFKTQRDKIQVVEELEREFGVLIKEYSKKKEKIEEKVGWVI